MKVCKYCGTEGSDFADVCVSCGARTFKNKCGNCGNVYDEGCFCPRCGVKAGAKVKKCPRCGKEYYSAACPDCGYTGRAEQSVIVFPDTIARPVKKRKTWLWVLGWIFMFPVPLTILMVRNQKMKKWVKILIIIAAWLFYLLLAFL